MLIGNDVSEIGYICHNVRYYTSISEIEMAFKRDKRVWTQLIDPVATA